MAARSTLPTIVKDTVLIVAGIFSAGFGLKGFLLSSNFIDGGVVGISMLAANFSKIPLSIWIPIINLPFIVLGYRRISRIFALKSTLAITGLALCLAVVPFPDVTPDKLLTAVFGGVFIGAGIGLTIRGGAVLDGTEIAALLVSRRSPILQVGDVILILNIFIFGAAVFLLGVEEALYSMLTYVAASKTIDFLVHGIEEYTAVIIISDQHERVRRIIAKELGKGVTILKGEKGYGKRGQQEDEIKILYSIVTRLEVSRLRDAIALVDPAAFVVQHSIGDVQGGFVKQRPLH